MRFVNAKTGLCLILLGLSTTSWAQAPIDLPSSFVIEADKASYADIADLVVISPLIADATIRNVQKLPTEQSIGVPASLERVLVEADVRALIRGEGGIMPRVRFLLDIPKNAKGKIPKLQKQRLYLFGRQVTGRPSEVQLTRPNALASFSTANDALVRGIVKEAVQVNAPPRIAGVSSAFHSAGTVLGEGETQIFLKTDNDQPLSLTILSRPGQQKQWAVSTAEVIDASATAPQRFTLLWYRLACGLPRVLPADRVEGASNAAIARAQADYKFVIDSLGPCERKR
ncbi:MAG: hypothetical protein RLZZ61_1841 [Pseudomonadota bacterium]|jgi:hypothetical protein